MDISKQKNNSTLRVILSGRLDTTTAPELEKELSASYDGVKELILDVSAMEYISSAGLRVFLAAQKTMNMQGSMTVKGASPDIMEIFKVTGFVDILNIE
ncbi:MAG: STAS domain-containing protein [Porcipelethomonas sp.]